MRFYTSASLELKVYSLRSTYVTDKIAPFRKKTGSIRFRRKRAESRKKWRKKRKKGLKGYVSYVIDASTLDS
jgi:hypothetical protein